MTQAISQPASPSGGRLTTHVLDTVHGRPAAGMRIDLFKHDAGSAEPWQLLRIMHTNDDGRVDGPLLSGAEFVPGRYRLLFDVESYFRALGMALPEPAFLGQVPLDFGIADAQGHYHVPLLASPWAFSTYRGS